MSPEVFAKIIPLALGAAVSPAVLLITLEILATAGDRRRKLAGCYLAGSVAIPLLLGILGLFAASILFRTYPDETATVDFLDVTLGALLILAAAWILLWRGKPKADRPLLTPAKTVGLGLFEMATNFSTLIMVVAGLREVAHAREGFAISLLCVILLVAGSVAPIWVPLVFDLAAPVRLHQWLQPLDRFAKRFGKPIGAAVSALTGIYLLLHGLTR